MKYLSKASYDWQSPEVEASSPCGAAYTPPSGRSGVGWFLLPSELADPPNLYTAFIPKLAKEISSEVQPCHAPPPAPGLWGRIPRPVISLQIKYNKYKVKQKTDRQKAGLERQNKENTKVRENKGGKGNSTSVSTGALGHPDFSTLLFIFKDLLLIFPFLITFSSAVSVFIWKPEDEQETPPPSLSPPLSLGIRDSRKRFR